MTVKQGIPDPLLGGRFLDAVELTIELHSDQARKTAADEPDGPSYLGHLLGVAALVIDAGGSEDEAIGALLHDAVEDQGGGPTLERIRSGFGAEVARIVEECSDSFGDPKPPWEERKRSYLAHLEQASSGTLLVSLADKLYNARAIVLDHRTKGEPVWLRFNAGRDDVLWYYRSLAERFCELRPSPLADELARTVDELERLACTAVS